MRSHAVAPALVIAAFAAHPLLGVLVAAAAVIDAALFRPRGVFAVYLAIAIGVVAAALFMLPLSAATTVSP